MRPRRPWLLDELRARYEHPLEVRAYARQVPGGLLPEEAALLARVAPTPCPALALGCGAGREVFALAESGFPTTGADISAAMLAAARRIEAARRGRAKAPIHWVWMPDPLSLPFPDGSFGLVTALAQLLSHIPGRAERIALLSEAARVLVPGGILVATFTDRQAAADLLTPGGGGVPAGAPPHSSSETDDPARENSFAALEREAGWEEGDILVWHPSEAEIDEPLFFHLHTREEVARELEAAGFTGIEIYRAHDVTPTPLPDAHRYPFVVARRP